MKVKLYITLLSAISLFVLSCRNEIEFNGNETQPLLVVNCFCTPDSIIKVHVSKSKFFLQDDSSFEFVNDATVNLWINDVKTEKLVSTGNGYYTATYKPKTGDRIKITAQNNQFSEVSGETDIYQSIPILSVDTASKMLESTPLTYYNNKPDGTYTIDTIGYTINRQLNYKVNFSDPANTKNYYRLVVTIRNYFLGGFYYDSPFYFNSDDLVFGNNSESSIFEGGNYSYYNEFSDDLFNGKNYGLMFYTNQYENVYYKDINQPKSQKYDEFTPIKSELLIDIQNISNSYYFYIKSRVASSSVVEFFSEPVQIHSNVKGGIGIIGSYTHSIYMFQIPISTEQKNY